MARTKISEFSATASDNTDIDSIDIAEGCAPSGINNAIRELMAQLKDMQTGASGDTFTFTALNATTADINGGTVDGAIIGGASPAAATVTSLNATSGVISANSSGDALRITQTGAGNALLVEDSANPDATPFVVDGSGNVIVGTITPSITTYPLYVEGNGAFASTGSNVAATSPTIGIGRRRTGGASVGSGDSVGKFSNFGWDGTSFIEASRIEAAVDGTPGTNDMPGRLVFSTTADGASSPTERMRIDNAGKITDQYGNIRAIPKSGSAKTTSYSLVTTDVGRVIEIGSGGSVTIPDATFAAGDAVTLFNNTAGSITITCSITTAYIGGTDTDKATMTLATRGVATILFISGTVCVVQGNVT